MSAVEIVRVINDQDATIAAAVRAVSGKIAEAIDVVADRLRRGGRLIYIGAGTSGRLGVLDASECPPTFGTDPQMVVGLIAGGQAALTSAVEGAEDYPQSGAGDLAEIELGPDDVVVGIATSGRTPYVIGALQYAATRNAFRIGFSCNRDSKLGADCDLMISPIVGPEVVTGSTRMKAGTATKMVLNMITTGAMIRMGKTYGNLMVDLKATNRKLQERSQRIVSQLTDLDELAAAELLSACDGEVKTAIVSHRRRVDAERAREILRQSDQHLRRALEPEA